MRELVFQNMHPILQRFKKIIDSTYLEQVEIEVVQIVKNKTDFFASKYLGYPYLPIDMDYPRSPENGEYLIFLAQFNLKEIPHLPNFPMHGILQFYFHIDGNLEKEICVFYHEDILPLQSLQKDFSFLPDFPLNDRFYRQDEIHLNFSLNRGPICQEDYRIGRIFPKELINVIKNDNEVRAQYLDLLRNKFSKIGGYHYSSNGFDPRDFL